MNIPKPPPLVIRYSHDSSEHEERVLALCNRLRAGGNEQGLTEFPQTSWKQL